MTIKVAINGLGRIGRCLVRAIKEGNNHDIELVAVNGPADTDAHLHLLQYDSVHGRFLDIKKTGDDELDMGFGPIAVFHERNPEVLPWGDLGVDVVLECTGKFNNKESASQHINAGAKRVLISAPASEVDATIVYGVNHNIFSDEHTVLSVGSCTTNCLAPVANVLNDAVGIERGYMTTIHAYTNDQNILDNSHRDLRRARSAALSMIPTSTGAANALSLVIPELEGKLDGSAMRVPTPNVSCIDLTFTASKETSVADIHRAIDDAENGAMNGVLGSVDAPLVSIDFNHDPHSAIFDKSGTKVIDGTFVRVMAWYDNEWGFSNRMLDVSRLIAGGK